MKQKISYEAMERRVKELEQKVADHKNQQTIFQNNEFQANKYLSVARVIFIALDKKSKITLINEYGLESLGYQKEELIGKNWFKTCLPEEYREDVLKVYHQLMAGEIEPVEYYENPILRKDGTECIIAWHNTILKDSNGDIVGSLSSGNNITEQKQAEQVLMESEKKYRNILESIQDSYLETDLKGNFQFFNRSFCKMLGRTTDELTGENFIEFLDKKNSEKVFLIFHEVYKTGKPAINVTWEFTRKNGTIRHTEASISLIMNEKNEPVGFRGFGRDITDRKKSEIALLQAKEILALNESRFRDISLSMADWIWEVDTKGRYVFSAGNSKKILGYGNDELLGKTPFDFMTEEDVLKIKPMFLEIVQKNQPIIDLKNWNRKKDGSLVCLLTNGVPVFDEQGEFTGYRGVDKDISKDLEIEEKLKQTLEITEKIIDNIPIGMVIVGEDKVIQRINNAALAMTGHDSEEEIVGHTCHKNLCPADQGKCPITDMGQTINNAEKMIIHKDGHLLPVYKTAIPLEINGQNMIIEAFMDISLLKKKEDELRESREKFRTVMETIVEPVVVYDGQGKVIYLNPAFTRVFGWSSDELLGNRIDFVPDKEIAVTQEAVVRVLKGEGMSGFETERTTKSGSTIAVRIGAALILDRQGKPDGMVVNFQDITREKMAQDKLNKMNQELEKAIKQAKMMAHNAEAANTAKSEFLANMSHEIRTPLNGVIGMTGLLLDTDLTSDQRHYASIVQNSGEGLLRVINDILDFSKIEAGKLEMEIIDFDLRYMLDDFASMMSVHMQEKALEFLCAASPDVPALLRGDPGRLRQILANLVGNAAKFTAKGEISVRVYLEKETQTNVRLLFSIKDTGIGIPAEKHDLLFQSFTQADTSTTREFGGTGLGLTISKKLCEMMGGKIGVNSELGKGSEFWFTALFKKQVELNHLVMPVDKSDMKGIHVLIVDDNKTNREILQGQLGSWGCRIKEAVNGPEALRILYDEGSKEDPFQMAILDMQMPIMDGLSLGKIIKSDDKLKSIHLVMMTSMGQVGDAKEFEEIGFSAYLIKPVGYSDLFDCLATILSDGSKPEKKSAIITRHTIREQREKSVRILLAEDNITNQQVATGLLKKFGFVNVKTATNGLKTMKELEEDSYDLVLMDIQMPEMDGLEAARQIRKIESESDRKRIPIIAMTAHAMKEDRDKCLSAGMDDYVSKPIDPKKLLEALERCLPKEKPVAVPLAPEPDTTLKQKTIAQNDRMVFDKDIFMDRLMGDADLAAIVISGFLEDIPRQMELLKGFVYQKNAEDAGKKGHQIKGAAGNVGAEALRKIAFEIEIAGKARDFDRLNRLVPQLEEAFAQLKTAMEEMIL